MHGTMARSDYGVHNHKETDSPDHGKTAKRKKTHSSSSSVLVSPKHDRNKKLKRSRSGSSVGSATTKNSILSGMTVAVSTLQNEQCGDDDNKNVIINNSSTPTKLTKLDTHSHERKQQLSYKAVTDHCRAAGATVSSQVHKKVKCVLCTPAAVAQATQRVRKAKKKSIPLVDVAWLFACLQQSKRLEFGAYVLDYPEQPRTPKEPNSSVDTDGDVHVESVDAKDVPDDTGWTEAVNVGCCCVCHENGDTDCAWCTDCNV